MFYVANVTVQIIRLGKVQFLNPKIVFHSFFAVGATCEIYIYIYIHMYISRSWDEYLRWKSQKMFWCFGSIMSSSMSLTQWANKNKNLPIKLIFIQ